METALFGVFDFVARNKWLQYILIALAVIATLGLYLAMRDEGVKRRERERWLRKQAEEQARLNAKKLEIQETRSDDIRQAEHAAAEHVVSGSVDELRDRDPGLANIVYGAARGRAGQAEGR